MHIEDFGSPTWKRLRKLLQERLQELRELNDSSDHSPDKTALIRGQIRMVKELLALDASSARVEGIPEALGFPGLGDTHDAADAAHDQW